MKKLWIVLLVLWPLWVLAQQTVTIPSQTITVVIPAQTVPVSSAPPTTCTPPQVLVNGVCTTLPPATGTFWIYQAGVFNWYGDYSWNTGTINYKDTSGKPTAGPYDIAVPIVAPWGGYQPYAQNKSFDITPYKYVLYSLKPTIANQIFATVFNAINDIQDGIAVTFAGPGITKYGPVPQVGVWSTYKVPLADFNIANPLIQKLTVADGTGVNTNLFFIQSLGFSAN